MGDRAARAHPLDGSLADCASEIRAGRVSPVELAEAALDRCAKLGPVLGCFVTFTPDRALADARKAEEDLRHARHRGPLHGIPFGLKDNIDTAGIRTTWGSDLYAQRVPERDATVVSRLASAGGVLVGKLALTELAMGVSDPHSSISDACRNPWSTAHWAGGSSGGPAAAVAARLVPFALGTDTTGSLLVPAAFCGVTGHRPTYGVLSRAGVLPYAFSLDRVGVLARSALDCATVLSCLAGRDPADASSVDAPFGLPAVEPARARGLRAAVLDLLPGDPAPPEISVLYDEALAVLREAGIELQRAVLPQLPFGDVLHVIMEAEAEIAFDDAIASGGISELRDPFHRGRPWTSLEGRPSDYVRAQVVRAELQRAMREFLREFDLVISPNGTRPPLVDERLRATVGGDPMNVAGTLLGLPATAVPIGNAGPRRLPVSLTVTGRPLEDARVLAAAASYQSRTTWHLQRPPLAHASG